MLPGDNSDDSEDDPSMGCMHKRHNEVRTVVVVKAVLVKSPPRRARCRPAQLTAFCLVLAPRTRRSTSTWMLMRLKRS